MEQTYTDAVPEHDPDQNALIDYGLTGVAVIPVLGGVVADLARGILTRNSEARQAAFNQLVGQALDELSAKNDGLTKEALMESDEFAAAFAKASRIASETETHAKRVRLARVLAHMGPWDRLSKSRRQLFLGLVERYDDLHIVLLSYLANPRKWINDHVASAIPDYGMGSISTLLGTFVFPGQPNWLVTVRPIVAAFTADGLAEVPLMTTMTGQGLFESRTSQLGDEFLAFLSEPDTGPSIMLTNE